MSASMTFKLFPFIVYAGETASPTLVVELVGVNGTAIRSLALVDTGAEWSVLSWKLCLELGADPAMFHSLLLASVTATARVWAEAAASAS
jgi:hypothetical protein